MVTGLTAATIGAGLGLAVRAFGPEAATVMKGQTVPFLLGWVPDPSKGYGGVRPVPVAVFSGGPVATATWVFVLTPTPGPATCPVRAAKAGETTLELDFEGGSQRSVRF